MNIMLSVIIPCYNEKPTIHKLLEAVEKSSVSPKEVIVVDDASTDGFVECQLQIEIYLEANHGRNGWLRQFYFR